MSVPLKSEIAVVELYIPVSLIVPLCSLFNVELLVCSV